TVGPRYDVLPPHQVGVAHQTISHQLRVLDEVGGMGYDAWNEDLAIRQPHVLPHFPLMLMAHIGGFYRVRLGFHPQDDFQGVFQGDVHGMGTLPASPAHMVPDSVFWDTREGVVQGLNPQGRFFTVVLEGEMAVCAWVRHVPSTHHPWVIYLEDEASVNDR